MKCCDELPKLTGLSTNQVMIQLNTERNEFAKSRQQWIQAAFDLDRGNNKLFKKLMTEELCDNCIDKFFSRYQP